MVLLLGWCLDQTCLPRTTTQYLIYLPLYPPADTLWATSAPWPGNQGCRPAAILNRERLGPAQAFPGATTARRNPGCGVRRGHCLPFARPWPGPAVLSSLNRFPGTTAAAIWGQRTVSCRVKGILKRHLVHFDTYVDKRTLPQTRHWFPPMRKRNGGKACNQLCSHYCLGFVYEATSSLEFLRRRQWHPTPVLLPGKSHGQSSLVGCSLWGR